MFAICSHLFGLDIWFYFSFSKNSNNSHILKLKIAAYIVVVLSGSVFINSVPRSLLGLWLNNTEVYLIPLFVFKVTWPLRDKKSLKISKGVTRIRISKNRQHNGQNPYIEEEQTTQWPESVYRRRTDNTMTKRKSTKGQITIYKTYI
jgi:TPP-dependent indolepyruvate ferredoxin oxidoreductase alpha subunit